MDIVHAGIGAFGRFVKLDSVDMVGAQALFIFHSLHCIKTGVVMYISFLVGNYL